MTWATALSRAAALVPSPSQSSIILTARIVAMGLTLYCPAYFGAEPCVGSNTASLAPMLPEQPKPRPPTIWAQRSEIMSPYRSEEHTTEIQSLRHLVCRL